MHWKMSGCVWRSALLFLRPDAQPHSQLHSALSDSRLTASSVDESRTGLSLPTDMLGIFSAGR